MPTAVVASGGPGGLMAAEVLATAGVQVAVLERMPSVGRKLLLAGRSGLNLTHAEPLDDLLGRYGAARPRLEAAIRAFGPDDLRAWAEGLGQPTFVGSSGRVFPEAMRATRLLRAWLGRLEALGVEMRTRHPWTGETGEVTVLALGGASWPRTGSDGRWPELLSGIDIRPFRPSNCGFLVDWSDRLRSFEGTPLKNVVLSAGDASARGDTVITRTGIEGGAVYAVSAALRDATDGVLTVDLDPDGVVAGKLARRRPRDSTSTALRRAGLPPVAVALLREVGLAELAPVRLPVTGPAPIDRAISSAGGVALHEVDDAFMLGAHPGTFVAGEMLDWEAPTGGYLLQATFSTAVAAARGALGWLERS